MKGNYFRYYKPNLIIGFIVGFGSTLSVLLTFLIKTINQYTDIAYYQFPTVSIILGGIIIWIDKKLWRLFPFRYLFNIPKLGGRYEGRIFYLDVGDNNLPKHKDCALEVLQTGSKIKLNCYFSKNGNEERTPSESLIESVVKNEDDSYSLVFTYRNHGLAGKFQEHSGTNILKFIENDEGKFLKGSYYTNREPQTKGEMEVKFVTNKLKKDY